MLWCRSSQTCFHPTYYIKNSTGLHLNTPGSYFTLHYGCFTEVQQFGHLDIALVTAFDNCTLADDITFDDAGRADNQFCCADEIALYDTINTNITVAFDFTAYSSAFNQRVNDTR